MPGSRCAQALLCAPGPVTSLPGLSLQPVFRRGHGSIYKALDRGRLDPWIAALDTEPDSWTAPVDVTRIPPGADTTTATSTQIRDLVATLAGQSGADARPTPLFVFDAGYNPAGLTYDLTGTNANLVVRIRGDRVFYADPPAPPPGRRPGRPRRHGHRFECAHPNTWPEPDHQTTGHDDRYGTIDVRAWERLHPQLAACRGHFAAHTTAPIVVGTIIRVQVEHLPKPTSRATTTLWLWAAGPDPDLNQCWQAYLHRFDIEHTFRFLKGTLGWTLPRVCTPQQADTWTWIVAAAYTQLRLAKHLIADQRLPWERSLPQHRLTPTRVRRGFMALTPTLRTPTHPPKTRTPGPGRPKGTKTGPRKRHPAIKKKAA